MSAAPNGNPTTEPGNISGNGDHDPTPAEVLTVVVRWLRDYGPDWLRRYWEKERPKSKWHEIAMVVLTVVIAGASIYSAWVFQGQLTEARKSFRIDERAWVELEPITATPISPPDDKFPAGFSCSIYPKNVGKTVATDISVRAVPALRTGEFTQEEMKSLHGTFSAKKYSVNIGPEKTTESVSDRFPSNPVPKVLAPNTVSNAPFRVSCQGTMDYSTGGHAFTFVVGRIDYCDAFSVRHWKTFCFYVANAKGDVWNCQEGNEEDRNSEEQTSETSCGKPN